MTQEQALNILKTGASIFLTGEPGAGKTHIINSYTAYLRTHGIAPAITAATGIAATHIGGMTIHSWSGIGIRKELAKDDLESIAGAKHIARRIKKAKVLIIDEVSMLDGGTLDMVAAVCRKVLGSPAPFGGLRVIFVGDFFQLPPISKTDGAFQFAFQSNAWAKVKPVVCYLTEQHRQDDADFLSVLAAIRAGNLTGDHIRHLESRLITTGSMPQVATKLFSHNAEVDRVNADALARLPGKATAFFMSARGFGPIVEGLKRNCLSPEKLELKIGAAVMFTKNNPPEGFANGTLGEVSGFSKDGGYPLVRTREGATIRVEPMEWVLEDGGAVRARIEQVPLRLAWAMTIHKSQGTTLDAAIMDLSAVFEFGQGYVALSRVRRLSGLHLLGYNPKSLLVHPAVLAEDQSFRAASERASASFGALLKEELERRQNDFIKSSDGSINKTTPREQAENKKVRVDTHAITLVLFKEGKSIAEIASARDLSPTTILSHMEHLFIKGKINRGEVERLLRPGLSDAMPAIQAVFRKLNDGKLSPVFEKLGGKYSYDDLRLARMLMG